MILEFVHQAGAQATHLLTGRDREEDNLGEALGAEGAEDTTSEDLRALPRLSSHDYHSLVLAVHGQLDDVITRHFRQLLGDDVLQVNQVPHGL